MKRGGQKYAFVWYRPETWLRLKATAADANDLEDTCDEWHANAESTFKALRRQGMWLEQVEIDIDALLAWCKAQGQAPDATARSTYAVHLLQGRDQGQDLTPARVQAKEKNRQGARAKRLSPKAHDIAMAAEQFYREQKLPVDKITHLLKISKNTLYRYLRHQGVCVIAPFPRHAQTVSENRRGHVSRMSGRQEWGWQERDHLVK